jgi:hypothetical protein
LLVAGSDEKESSFRHGIGFKTLCDPGIEYETFSEIKKLAEEGDLEAERDHNEWLASYDSI